jgi:hypothetical protein
METRPLTTAALLELKQRVETKKAELDELAKLLDYYFRGYLLPSEYLDQVAAVIEKFEGKKDAAQTTNSN